MSGDKLWDIASKLLGDPTRWQEIYDANQSLIEAAARQHPEPPVNGMSDHGHWIFAGTSLNIPGVTCGTVTPPEHPSGTVCLFDAPNAVDLGLLGHAGHVAWSFRLPGTDQWYYGSTDGPRSWTDPGLLNNGQTWWEKGDEEKMLSVFKDGGYNHESGYYTRYRCTEVADPHSGDALDAVAEAGAQGRGYNVATDNCLTRAVGILNSYGASLPDPLNLGLSKYPNDYFDKSLDEVGWPAAKDL